jgi:hypothetical protein
LCDRSMFNINSDKIPFRCRWFGHSWGQTDWSIDHAFSSDRHERYEHKGVKKCWRCGIEQKVEWFDSTMYWNSIKQDNEDYRLEQVIRKAIR